MAIFRVKKTRDFTIMSNHHLRDKKLSLKAKGLLSLILSLPEDWDYTLKGLSYICKEGIDAVRMAVKELEDAGYIERRRFRNERGQLKSIEYIIHEVPETEEDTIEEPKSENTAQEPVFCQPIPEKSIEEAPTSEIPILAGTTQLNTNIQNTKGRNTDLSKYPSINLSPKNNLEPESNAESEERWIDRYNQNIEFVKSNIEYEGLCTIHDRATLDNIVSIMAEVLTVDRHSYTIEGCEYPAVLIKKRFSEVDYSVMDAFLMQFENKTEKIRNIKSYLITSMYNAPSTASAQIHNAVIHDIYGMQR
ncbi:MAG: DUF6017 domain-containing protein [Clostridia bacterium]|nr:DUF6017 domain-containing protein [Clostridia bacterium]